MTSELPDIAMTNDDRDSHSLEWVGMQGIDLPVTIAEPGYRREHHALVDAQVNLPRANVRGIHMSRLHQLLDAFGEEDALTPRRIGPLLKAMIDSHSDCGSDRARVQLGFNLLLRRGALETADIGGWRSYPVLVEARIDDEGVSLYAEVRIAYSSTCPCSASLSRQLIERAFLRDFGQSQQMSVAAAANWLREHATLATPHGQRSDARVRVAVSEADSTFGLVALVDHVEKALSTPVQTAVKRIDEQAFAARNGQNLMFVEDATRRVYAALEYEYSQISVNVTHMESLHAHDAVASIVS